MIQTHRLLNSFILKCAECRLPTAHTRAPQFVCMTKPSACASVTSRHHDSQSVSVVRKAKHMCAISGGLQPFPFRHLLHSHTQHVASSDLQRLHLKKHPTQAVYRWRDAHVTQHYNATNRRTKPTHGCKSLEYETEMTQLISLNESLKKKETKFHFLVIIIPFDAQLSGSLPFSL